MNERVADVVVIGAGPAGCALALGLERSGYDVVVCERHRIARDKLCGETLSAQAWIRLGDLGLADAIVRDFDPPRIAELRVTAPGERDLVHPLTPPGWGLSRLRLDTTMAGACLAKGVELRERWRASSVRAGVGETVVEGFNEGGGRERLRGRVVVGAFGKEEHLAEKEHLAEEDHPATNRGSHPAGGFIAWKAHYTGEAPRGMVELHTFRGGYCGVAEIEDNRINVCALAARESFHRAGNSTDKLMSEAAEQNPALAQRLSGLERLDAKFLTAARMNFRARRPIAGPLLHLGDAAAFAAPLCGDGIAIALSSAALAREWVIRHLAGEVSGDQMLAGYSRDWARAFQRPLRVGDALQRLLIAPRASTWMVGICNVLPGLTEWILRQAREERPLGRRATAGAL